MNLVSRLADSHQLTYVAHRNADEKEAAEAREYFESMGIRTVEVDRTIPRKSGWRFYARLAANLFSPLPYSVATHTSHQMKQTLQQLEQSGAVDLWHCEWSPYTELFRGWRSGPLVIAAHNVESLIWKRYTETESNPVKRWYIRQQWKKFVAFERWAFDRATCTIAVSEPDARLARRDFGAQRIEVVDNGVDFRNYAGQGTREERTLLFLGSLDWRPNLDGIQQFIVHVWPRILEREPNMILRIVGRNPASWLVDLANEQPGIQLCANVPEVVPYLSSATAMIVPLRVGGGSRLKIIEAAANGLPVISTRVGAEGLEFRPAGEHYQEVERIDDMVDPILDVVRNRKSSEEMARRAREFASKRYDWDSLASQQSRLWQSVWNASRAGDRPGHSRSMDSQQTENAVGSLVP